jgi:hypothetical protein
VCVCVGVNGLSEPVNCAKMLGTVLLSTIAASVTGFGAAPHCVRPRAELLLPSTRIRYAPPTMEEDSNGPKLPQLHSLSPVLLTLVVLQSANTLSSSASSWLADGPVDPVIVLANVACFAYGVNGLGKNLGKLLRSAAPKVNYDFLEGREVNSLAREAGEWALAGTVPTQSEDGYELATFAGGCFWGVRSTPARKPFASSIATSLIQASLPPVPA